MRVVCPFGHKLEAPNADVKPTQTPTFWYRVGNYVLKDGIIVKTKYVAH